VDAAELPKGTMTIMFQITLLEDLSYTRLRAADSGSTSRVSEVEGSRSFIFFVEARLDPLKHLRWFWSEIVGENTSMGVCTTSPDSGFGTLKWYFTFMNILKKNHMENKSLSFSDQSSNLWVAQYISVFVVIVPFFSVECNCKFKFKQ